MRARIQFECHNALKVFSDSYLGDIYNCYIAIIFNMLSQLIILNFILIITKVCLSI